MQATTFWKAVVADRVDFLDRLLALLAGQGRFPHRLNVSMVGSDLRVQIQLDPRYAPFVERATPRVVLGLSLPVARIDDLLQGKIWAALDPGRRASKRQKDLADIARLLETDPRLRERVPAEVLARLV